MYDDLVKRLREAPNDWHDADLHYDAADSIEELIGFVQEAERDRDEYRERLDKANDVIEELSAKATPKRVGFAGWKGCRNTRYRCPYCNKYVRNDETYCHKCGQALMFPRISHTQYVPSEKQDVIVTWPDEPQKGE